MRENGWTSESKKCKVKLVGGAEEIVDLYTGETVTVIPTVNDKNLGVKINCILKSGDEDFCCGSNARLNLHERLIQNEDQGYKYIDAFGTEYEIEESFYYIDSEGIKQSISDKSTITALANGKLEFTDSNGNTFNVTREEKTETGIEVVTTLEGLKNINYFEQRQQELKELEQQTDAYDKTLHDYVLIYEPNASDETEASEEIEKEIYLEEKEKFLININSSNYKCYTKSEKLNLESISNQISMIEKQKSFNAELLEKYDNQIVDIDNQLESVDKQIVELKSKSLKNFENIIFLQNTSSPENKTYYKELIKEYVAWNENGVNANFAVVENGDGVVVGITLGDYVFSFKNVGSDIDEDYVQNSLDTFKSYINDKVILISLQNEITSLAALLNQKASLQNSKSLVELQKSAITNDSEYETLNIQLSGLEQQKLHIEASNERNKENVVSIYKDYLIKLNNLSATKQHIPVSYLKGESFVKGYNKNGDLVVIYDKHNGYVAFEYEAYYKGESKQQRVIRAVNEKEQFMQFVYDHKNLLVEITNSNGIQTSFEYSTEGELNKIVFSNDEYLRISMLDSGKIIITENETCSVEKETDSNNLSIVTKSNIANVSHNQITLGKLSEIFKTRILYSDDKQEVTVLDNVNSGFMCKFDDLGNILEYKKIERQFVVSANKYEYSGNKCIKVIYPTVSCINYADMNSFNFVPAYRFDIEYDEFDRIKKESMTGSQPITNNSSQVVEKEYFYNKKGQLSEVKVKTDIIGSEDNIVKTNTVIKKLEYNDQNLVVKEEIFDKDKRGVCGSSITEYVYDENNYATKTIKYNSLDPSSKYYSEQEIDENGQIVADFDASGTNKTIYFDNTTIQPNGSRFSLGYDSGSGNLAITQSVEDGEENSIQRLYTKGFLTRVISGNNVYDYQYNGRGQITQALINGNVYASYSYTEESPVSTTEKQYQNGLVEKVIQGPTAKSTVMSNEGESINIDELGTIRKETVYVLKNNTLESGYFYEYYNGEKLKSVTKKVVTENNTLADDCGESYIYQDDGKISRKTIMGKTPRTINMLYEYDENTEKLKAYTCADALKIKPSFDNLGRNRGRTFNWCNLDILSENISYLKQGDHATNLPNSISYERFFSGVKTTENIKYKYDNMGNICEIREKGELVIKYTYDSLNRLVREDNKKLNKTVVIEYDNMGNILSQKAYGFTFKAYDYLEEQQPTKTTEYRYIEDKLISFDGKECEYNYSGVPLTYKDNNVTWCPLTKKLSRYGDVEFEYDSEGNRIKKDNKVQYVYDCSGNLIHQASDDSEISYYYDYNNNVVAFALYSQIYVYKKDIHGNVIEILDFNGNTVVKYNYDAWGNHKVLNPDGTVNESETFIGNINPIRYRSYYYDTETGLYYLHSRYYDPEVGRFISMDDIDYLDPETIGGTNLYAYCNNNPVMYVDPSGNKCEWIGWLISGLEVALGLVLIITGVGVGAGLTLVGTGVGSIINSMINIENGGTFWGGWTGGQAGLLTLIPGVGSVASAFVGSVITDAIDLGWGNVDWEKAAYTSLIAGVFNILPSTLSSFLDKNSINSLAFSIVTLYDTLLASTTNSIVNIFWRGKNE